MKSKSNKNKGKILNILLVAVIGILIIAFSGCVSEEKPENKPQDTGEDYKTIKDMRGKEVKIQKDPLKVITISDSFIESVMTSLKVQDRIVGVGYPGFQWVQDNKTFSMVSGDNYTFKSGVSPVSCLNPGFKDITVVGDGWGVLNYETLAKLNPDVVIIRIGSCAMPGTVKDEGNAKRTIKTIESLGIPVVVIYAPTYYAESSAEKISDEILVIGEIFNKENKSRELADYLESNVKLIKERTKNVSDEDKPGIIIFGLQAHRGTKSEGMAGSVKGRGSIYHEFIENVINAKNAYTGYGDSVKLSAEQILALNPDIILLETSSGYHVPEEIYSAEYCRSMQDMDAVKNRRVYALPYSPRNCARRVEYSIDLMITAKAAYPDKFNDILVHEWVLEFYQKVYDVDIEKAKEIRSMHALDWMVKENF